MFVLKFKTKEQAITASRLEAEKLIQGSTTELMYGVVKVGEDFCLVVPEQTDNAVELPDSTELTAIPADVDEDFENRVIASKIEALWKATDNYIAKYISGVAIGILTLGVSQMKPKALEVTAWTQSIWSEYYIRKSAVTANSKDNHDYSSFGAIPFSVQDLKEEVGFK